MALDAHQPVRMAAVQMAGRVADVPFNLEHAERLATEAFERGARIVALPEFFSTPVVFDERLRACAQDADDSAVALLRRLASRHSGWVGGSLLLRRGGDIFNTYCFVQPDGTLFTHDKDIPTMWENAFYVGGTDDGVMATEIGGVGAAVCWELIRTRTVVRLRDRVRLVMAGSNWWSGPDNWPGVAKLLASVERYNQELADGAPVELARLLGVPVIHASHCGAFISRLLVAPGLDVSVPYRSKFAGGSKIVDAAGNVVVGRHVDEGAGVVLADILLEPQTPRRRLDENRFWIPRLSAVHLCKWHHENTCGRSYYRRHNGHAPATS